MTIKILRKFADFKVGQIVVVDSLDGDWIEFFETRIRLNDGFCELFAGDSTQDEEAK